MTVESPWHYDGPWRAKAIGFVEGYVPGDRVDGLVFLQDRRNIGSRYLVRAYRFPVGWRCGEIGRLPVPKNARRLAHRAMRKLR